SRVAPPSSAPPRSPSCFPTRRSSDLLWPLGAALLSVFRVKSGGYACVVVPAWGAVAALGVHALARGHRPALLPLALVGIASSPRSEEHTSELQSLTNLLCRPLLHKQS